MPLLTDPQLITLSFSRCLAHWGGEFAIARKYFSKDSPWRSAERDRSWLEFQVWKEWFGSGVYGPPGVSVADILRQAVGNIQLPKGGDEAPLLADACAALRFGRDELAHFTLLFALWQRAFPGDRADVPSWGVLPAGQRLSALRYRHRESPLGEIAVRLSEGGGLGLFFGIKHSLSDAARPFDQELTHAVERILADERHHLVENFVFAARRLHREADVARVVEVLDEICAVKLLEREEQFGVPREAVEASLADDAALYEARYLAPLREEIVQKLRSKDEV